MGITPPTNTDITVDKTTITLTSANWHTLHTITVSAADDSIGETGTITHSSTSGDPDYNDISISDKEITVGAYIPRGSVMVNPTDLVLSDGTSRSYAVRLNTRPTANVTVTIDDPTDNSDVTTRPDSLTFTPDNWITNQTVVVRAGQDTDAVDDTATVTHTATSTDRDYNGIDIDDVDVTVTDDEDVPVTVSFDQSTYTVVEGNTVTVKVNLSTDPKRSVRIGLNRANQGGIIRGDYSGVPGSVDFSSGQTSKTFTFTASQDTLDDDGESLKLTFSNLPTAVTEGTTNETVIFITDDDEAGITVDPTDLTVAEGGSKTYKVALDSNPTANVAVTVKTPTDNTDVTASGTLTFTPDNWDTEQTVTVSAAQDTDAVDDTATVTHTSASTDSDYNNATIDDVDVTVTDDEDVPVTVSYEQSVYTVAESDKTSTTEVREDRVTVTVVLDTDPDRTVRIPITKAEQNGATGADFSGVPSHVTFNAGDTEQEFTFTARHDTDDDDGESVLLGFGDLPDSVSAGDDSTATVSITDDDHPSVTVRFEQSTYTVAESDDTSTTEVTENEVEVKVILSADPERTVIIPLQPSQQGGITSADYSTIPVVLQFKAGEEEKTFTFSATHDTVDDDGESVKLTFGDLPAQVAEGTTTETVVSITDDDKPTSLTVNFGAATYTAAEGGNRHREGHALTTTRSRPSRSPSARPDRTARPTRTTQACRPTWCSTRATRRRPSTFTAAQDTVDDDDESVKLSFGTLPTTPASVSAGSTDEAVVSITDDDDPTVSVNFEQATYTVAEGASVTVKVTLSADPERTVTIPITKVNEDGASDSDYSGVPASVTFNSGVTEKTFSFTATQDTVDDDGESVSLTFGIRPAGVNEGTTNEATVNITDDDKPTSVSVNFEAATYTVAEGGTVTVKVTLSDDPEQTVTVPVTTANQDGASDSDYSGVPDNVVFNSGDTEKSFTFRAAQDTVDDDDESVKLGFGTLPTTPLSVIAGSTDESVVSITDDDDPEVTLSFEQATYTVAEGTTMRRPRR